MARIALFVVSLAVLVASVSATNAEGTKFLEDNKGKEGVTTLDSGLQIKARAHLGSPPNAQNRGCLVVAAQGLWCPPPNQGLAMRMSLRRVGPLLPRRA